MVDTNETSLHQVNLRNSSVQNLIIKSRTRRQTSDLSLINPSSALLLDPQSGNLLLSDIENGDIVNCSVINGACTVLVSASNSNWQPPGICGGTGEIYPMCVIVISHLAINFVQCCLRVQ